MTFEVRWSAPARSDILRLHDFLLDRARTVEELFLADQAIAALQHAIDERLARHPFVYRRAGRSLTRRELIIPFGARGYVAQYDIQANTVLVLGVRHQLESDYQ